MSDTKLTNKLPAFSKQTHNAFRKLRSEGKSLAEISDMIGVDEAALARADKALKIDEEEVGDVLTPQQKAARTRAANIEAARIAKAAAEEDGADFR